jgi:TRAP-type C4-dicarboxylate transport system permease small subunit
MKSAFRRAMDALYLVCMVVSGLALAIMTLVIPWGVFARYVLSDPSGWHDILAPILRAIDRVLGHDTQWPEPLSVLLIILFTFFAGAACYRAGVHISVTFFADSLRNPYRAIVRGTAEILVAALSVCIVIWGIQLVTTTWHQVIAEFPWLSVGVTYLPAPIGGAITVLFVLERAWLGPPPPDSIMYREPKEAH